MNAKFKMLNFLDPKENPCEFFFFNLRASRMCIKSSQHFCSSLNAKVYAFCHTHAMFKNTELFNDLPGRTAFYICRGWIAVTSLVSCTKSLTTWEDKKNHWYIFLEIISRYIYLYPVGIAECDTFYKETHQFKVSRCWWGTFITH